VPTNSQPTNIRKRWARRCAPLPTLRLTLRHHPRRRMIQYYEASMIEPKSCGVLVTPLEPVIGLAGGETWWRSMTLQVRLDRL
jgi:hypothetical protein